VSLDEEGFMMDIERFTKQQIPVQIFQEFMPEPGEKAEPIAMGRQTIWGGAGKPPSRDVMAAAAKAARSEMMTRIREKKAEEGQPKARGARGAGNAQASGGGDGQDRPPRRENAGGGNGQGPRGEGAGGGNSRNRRRRGGSGGPGQQAQGPAAGQGQGQRQDRPPRQERGPRPERNFEDGDRPERQPGANAHLGQMRIREPRPRTAAPGGQPDPLRTGIDAMRTGKRGAGGGNNNGNRNRGGKPGGGGNGGQPDPLRTRFGHIG
jgi:ATP-dependent RNA helicase RhlE